MARDCRLQKMLAECGVASRRKAEELIVKGRVKVNGRPTKLGDKVDVKKDIVTVDGEKITPSKSDKVYIMLHKPRGFITTMNDEMDRKCVAELVKEVPGRVYPIGRLDKDSEGILFMTNDGNFANIISHPSGHISKLYRVTVRPAITEDQITTMSIGMVIDGVKTAPCSVRVLSEEKSRTVLEIVLNEGRNRQIRKMCEALNLEVARLKRVAIGPVKLGMLQPGKYRDLKPDEIRRLTTASAKAREKGKVKNNDRNTSNEKQGRRNTPVKRNSTKRK